MQGKAALHATMLTAVTPDALMPQRYPIQLVKPIMDRALTHFSPTFDWIYAQNGRA